MASIEIRLPRIVAIASVALVLTLGWFTSASANVIYQYTGNPYTHTIDNIPPANTYTTSMRVQVTFELADPIYDYETLTDISSLLLSVEFRDGVNMITALEDISTFRVRTSSGSFVEWEVLADHGVFQANGDTQHVIWTYNFFVEIIQTNIQNDTGNIYLATDYPTSVLDLGWVDESPGFWRVIPEPGTAALLALGLAVLGYRVRRQRA